MTRLSRLLSLLCLIYAAAVPALHAEDYEAGLTPDDLYIYITELYTRKFDDTLLPKLDIFLQRYPDHPYTDTVMQYKIAVLDRQHRTAETIEAVRDYLQKFPQSPQREAFLRLAGACHFNLKDYANAITEYRELSESAKALGDRENAKLALAYCHQALQQMPEAVKLYQELAAAPLQEDHPARLEARVRYAAFLQNEGNTQETLKLYLEILSFPATPSRLRENLLYQAAGLAFQQGNDLALSERLYTTLMVEFPDGEYAANALRQLCLCKFRLGKKQEFLELVTRYREQFPSDVPDQQLELATADALCALERPKEALPWLRKVIEAPATAEDVLRQARYAEFCALATLEQDEATLASGDAFLEDYPNSLYKPTILALLAESAYRRQEFPRTRGYLENLLPLLAGDREATYQYGCLLTKLYEAEHLWAPAAELMEKLAKDCPDQRPTALMQAALYAEQLGDYERVKQLLNTVRGEFSSQIDILLQASELQYQIFSRAGQADVALQVARDTVEKTSGRERTVWLTRLGNHFLALNQYETAANCYSQALALPELPSSARENLLPVQVQLLFILKRPEALFALLPEFFAKPQPLPARFYYDLADFCIEKRQLDFARSAWTALLNLQDAPMDLKLRATLQLAETEMERHPQDAQRRLENLVSDCERQNLRTPADAYAMLAEIHLHAKNYDLALMNVDRSLEKDRPAVFATRAATRAWWVKAKFLYECQHDLENAKSLASLAGYLKTDDRYTPLARQLIIQILRDQHLDGQAAEEEARLKEKYPDFQSSPQADSSLPK